MDVQFYVLMILKGANRMKKHLLTGTLAIFTCCALIGMAQDAKPAKPAAAAEKAADPAPKKGRLPDNYGKLALNDTQKEKIYGIQGSYADKIDALEAQIANLKGKRDQEIEAVLTEDQKKILKSLTDASKEKARKDDTEKKGK
jgi:TolA-binding protein